MIMDGIGLVLVKTNELTSFKIYRQSIRRNSHSGRAVFYKGVLRVVSIARPAFAIESKRLYCQGGLASFDNTAMEGPCEVVSEALEEVFYALVFGTSMNVATVKNIVL